MPGLIDADATKSIVYISPPAWGRERDLMRVIDSVPTIDAEPVVRCKDCVYYRPEPYGDVMMCYEFANGYWPHPDDYCSHGKRKEVEAQDD